jgi:hypothetical protein
MVIIQYYNRVPGGMLTAFPDDGNSPALFEIDNLDWRKLDALGLPRIGKGWQKTEWGYQLRAKLVASKSKARLP